MSTFDEIARRVIVEAGLETYGISPEYVMDAWLISRYKRLIDTLPFGNITFRNDEVVVTWPAYHEGTVDIVQGTQSVTGHNTHFTIDMISKFIRFGVTRGWYQIIDVPDTTHLTLDTVFADASRTGSGYFIGQRYIEMPLGVRWLIDLQNVSRAFPLQKTHRTKLDEMFPDRVATPGVPLWWCPAGFSFNGKRVIELYPFPNTYYRLVISGYAYVDEPSLANSPLTDIDDRVVIEGGLADAMNYRASREADIHMVRSWLDVAKRHENIYAMLVDDMCKRDSADAPKPRVKLMIQKRDMVGIVDPLINAEQEVFNRAPSFG